MDGGDEVLNVAEPFEAGEVGDVHGAELGDTAEVVAEEIRDHDQLSHFFGVGLEFECKLGVTGGVDGTWAGAFDGAGANLASADAQEEFGRGRDQLKILGVEESRERGRGGGQELVEQDASRELPRDCEAMSDVDLVDVAGANVVLRPANGLLEGIRSHGGIPPDRGCFHDGTKWWRVGLVVLCGVEMGEPIVNLLAGPAG